MKRLFDLFFCLLGFFAGYVVIIQFRALLGLYNFWLTLGLIIFVGVIGFLFYGSTRRGTRFIYTKEVHSALEYINPKYLLGFVVGALIMIYFGESLFTRCAQLPLNVLQTCSKQLIPYVAIIIGMAGGLGFAALISLVQPTKAKK